MLHYASKNTPEFWKTWNKKMQRNVEKDVFINGTNDGVSVANEFASHFESVYCDSSSNAEARDDFGSLYSNIYTSQSNTLNNITPDLITVELVDKCIRKLKLGRASGPDDLCTENLVYA